MPNIAVSDMEEIMQTYENRESKLDISLVSDLEFMNHLHKEIELIYIIEGSIRLSYDFKEYVLEAGDLFFVFPNIIHGYNGGENTKMLMWILDSELLPDYNKMFKSKRPKNPCIKQAIRMEDVAYSIEAFQTRPELRSLSPVAKALLVLIIANTKEQLQLEGIGKQENYDWIYHALLWLNENYSKAFRLDDLAEEVGVSKYHLSRTFKERIGKSIPSYINAMRVQKAVSLLQTTEDTVTEIAFECGFESLSSFFRAFRDCGMETPKTYRENTS